jgi:hypothetical protein
MELWTYWLNVIQSLLTFFSSHLGLGTGFSINAAAATGTCAIEAPKWR